MEHLREDGMRLLGPVVCRARTGKSKGIWFDDNPLNYPSTIFLMQIICITLVSQLTYYVLRPLKQPKFVCYSLGGIFVAPFVMARDRDILESKNYFPVEEICVRVCGYLGGMYFLFLVAVKVDIGHVRRTIKSVSIIGLGSMLFCFSTVLALSFLVTPSGFPKQKYFHGMFAFALSLTRLSSLVYTFDELNILSSELAQLAVSTSVLCEFLSEAWLLGDLSHRHQAHKLGPVIAFLLFVLIMVYAVRPILTWIIKRTPDGKRLSQVYVVLILTGVLVGAVVADAIGTVQLGVVVMGLIVPNGPPLGSALIEKAEFFALEVLLPVMYIVQGYDTNLLSIEPWNFTKVLFIVFFGIAAKTTGTFLAAMARGMDSRHALLLGLMMNVTGPFDIVNFVYWKHAKIITGGLHTAMVLSQILVTAILAPIIDKLYGSSVRVNKSEVKKNMRAIQSTPLDGELKVVCCVYGEEHVPGLINLLHATNLPTGGGRLTAYIVQVNELSGRALPTIEPHGPDNQLCKITSKKMEKIMQAFENYLKPTKDGCMTVKAYNVTAPYKNMYEYICKLALDEKTPLIIVPFPDATQQFEMVEATALRNVNANVQVHAPCTVGILFDRSARFSMSSFITTPHKIAVLFFGGAHDREALSLGTRMSSHPAVSVTVYRLIPLRKNIEDHLEDHVEEKLDQQVINEFNVKNTYNHRSLYYESVVADAEQAMDAVRPLKNKYNLIMLGCQGRGTESMFDEILQWSENPELGAMGDFLASPDFSNGLTSVLVMQHYGGAGGAVPYNNGVQGIIDGQFHKIV